MDSQLLLLVFLGFVMNFIWEILSISRYKKTNDKVDYWLGGYLGDKNLSIFKRTMIFIILTIILYLIIFIIYYIFHLFI